MRRLLALSLLMLGLVLVSAPAEAVPCLGAGDVALLGSSGCVQGGLKFYDFAVSPVGVAAKIFLGGFTTVTGQDVNLNFQVSHDPSPANLADILLYYTVQTISGVADISAVDLFNPGHNVTIRETVCASPFDGGTCGSGLLADLVVPGNSSAAAPLASRQSIAYIRKDIQLLQDSFISEFTNSHDLASTPEPATLLLLGGTFATLGMAVRRRRAARQAG
ncbi:MAG TPA: PEP-CTERM sorting domain-containing protein [Methylomirabilota bacterium]|nr:PEP-CTERM sorting domain-containing protein [Methylomirabilota bacterium]